MALQDREVQQGLVARLAQPEETAREDRWALQVLAETEVLVARQEKPELRVR